MKEKLGIYCAPCAKVTNVECEVSLLAASALFGSMVEISGQVNDGFYDGSDITSTTNYWED